MIGLQLLKANYANCGILLFRKEKLDKIKKDFLIKKSFFVIAAGFKPATY